MLEKTLVLESKTKYILLINFYFFVFFSKLFALGGEDMMSIIGTFKNTFNKIWPKYNIHSSSLLQSYIHTYLCMPEGMPFNQSIIHTCICFEGDLPCVRIPRPHTRKWLHPIGWAMEPLHHYVLHTYIHWLLTNII